MFCIGSAAHGIGFPMIFMENAVDNSHAGSYFVGISRGICGFGIANIMNGYVIRFNGFDDFIKEFIAVCGYGIADIDRKVEDSAVHGNYAADMGKFSAGFIFHRNAKSCAVIIGVNKGKEFHCGFCFALKISASRSAFARTPMALIPFSGMEA